MTLPTNQHEAVIQLARRAYRNSAAHGFWDPPYTNVPEKLALIHEEISEALHDYRKGGSGRYPDWSWIDGKPEGFAVELADALIRTLDLAEATCDGVNLALALGAKLDYNEGRPYRHGDIPR